MAVLCSMLTLCLPRRAALRSARCSARVGVLRPHHASHWLPSRPEAATGGAQWGSAGEDGKWRLEMRTGGLILRAHIKKHGLVLGAHIKKHGLVLGAHIKKHGLVLGAHIRKHGSKSPLCGTAACSQCTGVSYASSPFRVLLGPSAP
jgi:hypothetical protein